MNCLPKQRLKILKEMYLIVFKNHTFIITLNFSKKLKMHKIVCSHYNYIFP